MSTSSDQNAQFDDLKAALLQQIEKTFPIRDKQNKYEVRVGNLQIADALGVNDIHSQHQARVEGRNWAVPVTGSVEIVDVGTGKVLVSRRQRITDIPKMTRHGSYIIGGAETTLTNQWRLRPGVYVKATERQGEHEAQFQLAKGKSFDVQQEEGGNLFMKMGTRKIPLYSVLSSYGVSDADMKRAWGAEAFDASKKKSKGDKDLASLYEVWKKTTPEKGVDLKAAVHELFAATKLDASIASANVGVSSEQVNGPMLLEASRKLVDVAAGRRTPDPIDSLQYKELWTAKDHIVERLARSSEDIATRVRSALKKPGLQRRLDGGDVTAIRDVVMPDLLRRPMYYPFTTSLAAPSKQTNPVAMLANLSATTIMGPGGIQNDHQITASNTSIDPSHLGFLDPVFTPEGNPGVTTHLAYGARATSDRKPVTQLYNLKTRRLEDVDAATAARSIIALPDQVRWQHGVPVALSKKIRVIDGSGELRDDGDLAAAHYVMPRAAQAFALETNLVPFMQNDSAGRTTMSARHMAQAISIKGREPPVVQVDTGTGRSFEELIGSGFLAHKTPIAGTVTRVAPGGITVRSADGKSHDVHLYDHYPTNDLKGMLHSTPLVKAGDQVKAGQLLADNNYTKGGVLSLGTNLRVAYLANGYNHEDGIAISESAAKKLASEHLYKPSLYTTDSTMLGKKAFLLSKPGTFSPDRIAKIGDDGTVKVGTKVKPGDPLILALGQSTMSGSIDASTQQRLGKKLRDKYSNSSLVWDSNYEGEVVAVHRSGRNVVVHVKTTEPAQIGSKLSTRHSAKGIVCQVLPDKEMPCTDKGVHAEMLLAPVAVPGRVNVGQILETAAGRIAEKTGKPYLVKNFSPGVDYLAKIKSELAAHGLKDTDVLYDPKTGRRLGEIMTGPHYVFQLEHQIDKKTHVRSGGPALTQAEAPKLHYDADTKIPRGGGHNGAQSLGALGIYSALSSGLHSNIQEMQTLRSDEPQARAAWAALTNGERLPPPKVPFAFKRFEAMLQGLGVNLEKTGTVTRMVPRTDAETRALSRGALERPTRGIRGKDDAPERGGLFDPVITGGRDGQHWSHIELVDAMPHPIFETSIAAALGIKKSDIPEILAGKQELQGARGPQAFSAALGRINVDKKLKELGEQLGDPKLKGGDLDKTNALYKALHVLQEKKMTPKDAWMIKAVPVLPPVYRPVATLPDGTVRNNPLNSLYRRLGMVNDSLQRGEGLGVPWDTSLDTRAGLYQELHNLFGTTPKGKKALDLDMRGTKEDRNKQIPGIIHMISGESPKDGYFQDKLVGKKQDYTARATIVVDPNMSVDDLGVPRKIAMELMRPMVAGRLIRGGYDPVKAHLMVSRKDPIAMKALEEEVKHRPVLLKRDPVLHQYGLVGQNVKLIDSEAISVSPLILPPTGGDLDGDSCWGFIYLRVAAPAEQALTVAWIDSNLQESGVWAPDMEAMKMAFAASTAAQVGNKGSWVSVDLANFPRVGTGRTDSRGNTEYEVPEWVEVYALDSSPGAAVRPYRVTHFSVHPNLDMVRVLFASGRCAEVSTDHSLYCVDPLTLVPRKTVPAEALGRMSPRPKLLELGATQASLPLSGGERLRDAAPLNDVLGYALGVLVGDGWATDEQVCCGKGQHADLAAGVFAGLKLLVPDLHQGWAETGYGQDRDSGNKKQIYCCVELAAVIASWIGQGAENKHLPTYFQSTEEEFRWALLSGLLDSDGTISHDKNGRFGVSYSTTSQRLAEEVQLLATTLGLRTSSNNYTRTKTGGNGEGTYYYVTFWTQDLVSPAGAGILDLKVPEKVARFAELAKKEFKDTATTAKQDLVPIAPALILFVREQGAKRVGTALYNMLCDTLSDHPTYMTRSSAKKLISAQRERLLQHELGERWLAVVANEAIVWDKVAAVDPIPGVHEAYDLTVPGPYNFMLTSQLIVWDTVSLYVPLHPRAVEEIKRIVPSQRTISDSSGDVIYAPANEAALSLYRTTLNRKKSNLVLANHEAAEEAFRGNKLDLDAVVHVKGVGDTTLGRMRIAAISPESYKKDILTNLDRPFDKKYQSAMMKDVAKNQPKHFVELTDKMSRLGFEMAYDTGHTVALKDFEPLRGPRDTIIAEARKRVDTLHAAGKDEEATKEWKAATQRIHDAYMAHYKNNPTDVSDMAVSGIKAKKEQFQGLVMAPMLVEDHLGRPSRSPITKSFAEGIDVGGYFIQAAGARRGVIQKVQAVAEPGYMSKLLVQSNIDQPVTAQDCGTTHGISLSIKNKDVVDRHLAAPVAIGGVAHVAGDIVTPEMLQRAAKERIGSLVVRSPLKCRMPQGVCSHCMGVHPSGHQYTVGENAGIVAAQALGERAAQLMLKQTHGGGIVSLSEHTVGDFDNVLRLFNAAQRGREDAAVAPQAAKVERVEKSQQGSWNIHLAGVKQPLRSRQKPLAAVKAGYTVTRGEVLSEGDPNIHDVMATQGHEAAQNYMAERIGEIYGREGVLRRHVELAVRNSTGLVRINNPGDHGGMLRGDYTMKTVADAMNRGAEPGKQPMTYTSILSPVGSIPLRRVSDWQAKLQGENLAKTIINAANQGQRSDTSGIHPIPGIAHGAGYKPFTE